MMLCARHLRCISFLLAHGVDPLPINGAPHGGTALHVAVSHIQNECVARLLHSIVAGVQGRPTTGLQDLHFHINTVRSCSSHINGRWLSARHALPGHDCCMCYYIISCVCICAYVCCLYKVYPSAAQTSKRDRYFFCQCFTRYVDQCNSWGLAPLHLAAFRGCQATVSSLIRGGAALDTPMRGVDVHGSADSRSWLCDGSTALHVACARGFLGIVMILLDAAAARGASGATWARDRG